jgi:hypothetical protein
MVCGVSSVSQVLEQHFTRPGEEPGGGKEVAEHKAMYFDALKGLEAAK